MCAGDRQPRRCRLTHQSKVIRLSVSSISLRDRLVRCPNRSSRWIVSLLLGIGVEVLERSRNDAALIDELL